MSDSGCPSRTSFEKSERLPEDGCPARSQKNYRNAPNFEALRIAGDYLKLQRMVVPKAPGCNTCHRIYYSLCTINLAN